MADNLKSISLRLAGHCRKLCSDREYSTLARLKRELGRIPRHMRCEASFNGWQMTMPDAASFLSAFEEIFVERIYAFPLGVNAPRILDLGANIGLSVLYFKKYCPTAVITALEPDPLLYEYLASNVRGNGFNDVQLVNVAAWVNDAMLPFHSDGADGGRLLDSQEGTCTMVKAVDTCRLLQEEQYDFIKMDIEGAEVKVLESCRDELTPVKYIFIEFHGRDRCTDDLSKVISLLAAAGFMTHIHTVAPVTSPFLGVTARDGYSMQLNIFGWRT
jgi:FkbM family methyltransferase